MKLTGIFTLTLLLLTSLALSQTADLVRVNSFFSPSVQLSLRYSIVLPANYHRLTARLPVVYLLHGHTGNYTSWITYAKLPPNLATTYQCIIVLPDAGNSFYVNWTGQTDGKPHRWKDMLVNDLMPDVEEKFRVSRSRTGRAIGGLSMGGFGAVSLGLSQPSLFSFVFSSAGALNFCNDVVDEFKHDTLDWNSPWLWSEDKKYVPIPGFGNWKERTPRGRVFRQAADSEPYNPFLLAEKTDPGYAPFLHLDVGDLDDHLAPAIRFDALLRAKKIKHSFLVIPGKHEVPYWSQAIQHTFLVMKDQGFFKQE